MNQNLSEVMKFLGYAKQANESPADSAVPPENTKMEEFAKIQGDDNADVPDVPQPEKKEVKEASAVLGFLGHTKEAGIGSVLGRLGNTLRSGINRYPKALGTAAMGATAEAGAVGALRTADTLINNAIEAGQLHGAGAGKLQPESFFSGPNATRNILLAGGIPLAAYGGYRLLAGPDKEEKERE